jgi:DNA-binding transcriptional ArsR family regulator
LTYASALAALADPTRRQVFERLQAGPSAVGELASALPVSRPAVSQHLKVLKEAGLVADRAEGTRRVTTSSARRGAAQMAGPIVDDALAAFQRARRGGAPIPSVRSGMNHDLGRARTQDRAAAAHAFEAFAAGIGRWWPASHSINASPIKEVVIEPRAGGRWYERGQDGSECDWGVCLPGSRPSVCSWHMDASSAITPPPPQVELRFIAESPAVRVELEHRGLERLGDQAEVLRGKIDAPGGWAGILERYREAAGA